MRTPVPRRVLLLWILAVLAASTALGALGSRPAEGPLIAPDERGAAPLDRRPLLDGGEMGLGDLRGRVVVMNFWASWCGPCRVEQPVLNDAHASLAHSDVEFVGVALQDSLANARAHAREFAVPYPSLFDPDSSYAAGFAGIGPAAIPTTVVVDRDGKVAARLFGAVTSDALRSAVLAARGERRG